MLQTHARLLEINGWEIQCDNPFEITHSESLSKATGLAAKLVLDYLLKMEEEELNPSNHTWDKHRTCKFCKSPLKVNILRPDKCVNVYCKNYFKRKDDDK